MRTFNVYKNASYDLQAVKKGFSWPGFSFGFIWAFVKGLPVVGALLVITYMGLT